MGDDRSLSLSQSLSKWSTAVSNLTNNFHTSTPTPPTSLVVGDHRFEEESFTTLTACRVCKKMLWGLVNQGVKCTVCEYIAHRDCAPKCTVACLKKSIAVSTVAPKHKFALTTFTKPTFCDYCSEMIWGLINQGFQCVECSYATHERCKAESLKVPCKNDCCPTECTPSACTSSACTTSASTTSACTTSVCTTPTPASNATAPPTETHATPPTPPSQQHNYCLVCFERDVNTVLIPCGHEGLCEDCASLVTSQNPECPVCRSPVEKWVRTFHCGC
ncbi:hypothetical protein Pelo_2231 [Pelomyxa schiedti]|nr:hypothetical protein Pelo_2231 [Pelomyxa schiedti]